MKIVLQLNIKAIMLFVVIVGSAISKSSILELESSRQGLLLPGLTDTADINALTPPDGMIIFLITDKSLRLRSNGSWKKNNYGLERERPEIN